MATVYYPSLAGLQAANLATLQRYVVVMDGNATSIGLFNNGMLHLYVAMPGEAIDPATLVGAITVASIRE